MTKAFVTFSEYMWAKNAEKIKISPPEELENRHPTKKGLKYNAKGLFV